MSVDNDITIIREIQDDQGGQNNQVPRKTTKEIAAERREAFAERFKVCQEKAEKKLKERTKIVKLRSKPLGQIKDSLKRLSEDFNFNFRGIDGSMRLYLGKGKTERDVNMSTQETASIFKKLEK